LEAALTAAVVKHNSHLVGSTTIPYSGPYWMLSVAFSTSSTFTLAIPSSRYQPLSPSHCNLQNQRVQGRRKQHRPGESDFNHSKSIQGFKNNVRRELEFKNVPADKGMEEDAL
jgi:hypothetical protein